MADVLSYLTRRTRFDDKSEGLHVTEINWTEHDNRPHTSFISNEEVGSWLSEAPDTAIRDSAHGRGSIRIVWIETTNDEDRSGFCNFCKINEEQHEVLVRSFELKQLPAWGIWGFFRIPSDQNEERKLHFYMAVPLVGVNVSWTHDLDNATTQALIWWGKFRSAREAIVQVLERCTEIYPHPMCLAYACALQQVCMIKRNIHRVWRAVRNVERNTGHSLQLRGEDPTRSYEVSRNYSTMSSSMSQQAQSMSFIQRDLECLGEFVDWVNASNVEHGFAMTQELHKQWRNLRFVLQSLRRQYKEYSQRIDIQLTALFNLIASEDTKHNIRVAEDSRRLAEASWRVSEAMKADSTAMKTLAAVTVVFLPSTFAAAFLSMPLFAWEDQPVNGTLVKRQFWVYWALSIPLTLLTVGIWLAWLRYRNGGGKPGDDEKGVIKASTSGNGAGNAVGSEDGEDKKSV